MRVVRTFGLISVLAAALAGTFVVYKRAPSNTFNPFCTYDLAYRLNVTIDADGQQYSSEVVRQLSRSRRWIRGELMGAGCLPTVGTTLSFRLANNRVVLMSSLICQKARQAFDDTPYGYEYPGDFGRAMRKHRKVDVTSFCDGLHRPNPPPYEEYDGYIVEDADKPVRWRGFKFFTDPEDHIRIVSAFAEATDKAPADELVRVAPALLKTKFNHDNWSLSPEPLIPFSRRYYPDKQFSYVADQIR
jgi:hypothetical protein